MKNIKAKVERKTKTGVPHRIYDVQSKASKADPKTIAENTIKKIAKDLKIKEDLSQLQYHETKESILGKHVLFQQQKEGKPISGAWIRVDVDNAGKVYNIQNDLVPEPVIKQASKLKSKKAESNEGQITLEQASEIALNDAKKGSSKGTVSDSELTWYNYQGVPNLVWKVVVIFEKPVAQWKYYIDAVTSKILKKINLLKSAKGKGRVFDPNPILHLNGTKLKPNSKIPEASYVEVLLDGLKTNGKLDGKYVSTKNTKKRVTRKSRNFLFTTRDKGFKEVMVYYHIDAVQRYIQDLGFNNILNKPILVDIDGEKGDNSYYLPETKSLLFGTGGVDDAEDAEIILHEYGHAIQDHIVPGFGNEDEALAMGEGFGDYLAASFFASKKPEAFRPTIGSWDGYFVGTGKPKCVRRLDTKKKYPKDLAHEEHDDGEIWSACLWQIRTAMGARQADTLIIAHHYLLTPKATFADAANALIAADKNMNKGVNGKKIKDIFVKRGILKAKKKSTPKKKKA